MPQLAERQRDFGAALLNPELPMPTGLVGPDGEPSVKRFSVYRNNVVAGLTDALQDAFPAVHRLVGTEFFRAMARVYVVIEPPDSPILLDYGAGFPDFIGSFEPAATLPYLADVARIERAWSEAYNAAEATPLEPAAFMAVDPKQLPAIRLKLHPSLRLLRSRFPALTIWQMNVGDGVAAPVDCDAGGEDVLIVRPTAEVEVRSLPPGSLEFIQELGKGSTLLGALEAGLTADRRFDLSANLSDLMRIGAVVNYSFTQGKTSRTSARRA
jgi:hypothetical protein